MSQSGAYSTGGGGGGGTNIEFVTGNDAVAVGPNPATQNINLVGINGGILTSGNAGTFTESIYLTNYSQQTTTTTNATPDTSMTIALGATPGVYTFDINVSSYNLTDTLGAGFSLFGTIRTTGAAGVMAGVPDKIVNPEGAMSASDVNLTISGNNAVISVLGIAAKTINWRTIIFYTFVS